MRRLLAALRRRPAITAIGALALTLALAGGAVAATEYTSRPAFCSSCHEMGPYYSAWDAGAHANVSCISCHVDPGLEAEVSHKVSALKEVYNHFTTNPTFPGTVTDIPDSRCLACHSGTIDPELAGFSHESHRGDRTCVDCHSGVGHTVTSDALAEAGILNSAAARAKERLIVAAVGRGSADLAGHVKVSCSSCHDLATTTCTTCHSAEARSHPSLVSVSPTATTEAADCTTCHSAGAAWLFTHPAAKATCAECHTVPAKHRAGKCATCHTTGKTWTFAHPAATAACTDCHTVPAKHRAGACSTCHTTGKTWTFAHPASKTCASCHKAPSKHYAGTCSACHSPKVPFANATFKHPASTATCTNCHSRPSGHSGASCQTCHKQTGASWKFSHPTSKTCTSCHKAPANHYGTTCVSCHSPAKAWSSATFSHPRVPGGEHTYRSFACTSCHPNGYASTNCTRCHDEDSDDD